MKRYIQTTLTISNGGNEVTLLCVEPEAEEYTLASGASMDLVDYRPPEARPVALFAFDDGLSVYGYDPRLYRDGIDLRETKHHVFLPTSTADNGRDTAERPSDSRAPEVIEVGPAFRIYRPTETGSPLKVVVWPDGNELTVPPGGEIEVQSGAAMRAGVGVTLDDNRLVLQSGPTRIAVRAIAPALGGPGD